MSECTKAIYITIIGPPNVGKSSLINTMTKQTTCMVSPKGHTTKEAVYAVLNHNNCQIIFIDTPGFSREQSGTFGLYNSRVNVECQNKQANIPNILLFLFEAHREIPVHMYNLIEKYKDRQKIAVFTKIDKRHYNLYLETTDKIKHDFNDEVYITSSVSGKGIDILLNRIESLAIEHAPIYNEDFKSSVSEDLLYKNAIRKALFTYLHKEIPHEVRIEYQKLPKNVFEVQIYCTESQKRVILSHSNIKNISIAIRENLSEVYGEPVHTRLLVKA